MVIGHRARPDGGAWTPIRPEHTHVTRSEHTRRVERSAGGVHHRAPRVDGRSARVAICGGGCVVVGLRAVWAGGWGGGAALTCARAPPEWRARPLRSCSWPEEGRRRSVQSAIRSVELETGLEGQSRGRDDTSPLAAKWQGRRILHPRSRPAGIARGGERASQSSGPNVRDTHRVHPLTRTNRVA